jgi:hypothetical protein
MSKYFAAIISIALLFLFFSITAFEAVMTKASNSPRKWPENTASKPC